MLLIRVFPSLILFIPMATQITPNSVYGRSGLPILERGIMRFVPAESASLSSWAVTLMQAQVKQRVLGHRIQNSFSFWAAPDLFLTC